MMKYCEGLLHEEMHKAYDESLHVGGLELDIQSKAEISVFQKSTPYDIHNCSLLNALIMDNQTCYFHRIVRK